MNVACRLAGLDARAGKAKGACPRDVLHPDGGRDPAFRSYGDRAWCFSCSQFWTPVSLYAEVKEVTPEAAAQALLDAIGYKPASHAHLWQQAHRPPAVGYAALQQALRNFCEGADPHWARHRMNPEVAGYLSSCLGYLVSVTDEQSAADWLCRSKIVMTACLAKVRSLEVIGGNP